MISCDQAAARFPELWACLENARKQGRLGHAFLVCSEKESTREAFAVALARLAACPSASVSGKPCGKCFSCRKLEEGTYPELRHLSPVGKMYQIQVGERINPEPNTVRYFEDSFSLTSASGADRKIGIIHDADRMNAEAQNALLKTLEEPPPETLLVLTTGNPSALLPTTRSRCQKLLLPEARVEYDFPGHGELAEALHGLFFAVSGDAVRAEALAVRMIAVAASLKGNAENETESAWAERIRQAADLDPALAKRLEKQQSASASGEHMRLRGAFLSCIRDFAGEVYMLSSGADPASLPNPELPVLPREGERLPSPAEAERMLGNAEELLFTLRFNVNEELAIRDFVLNTALGGKKARS